MPLVKTFAYNAIGNLTSKSDVGTYSYPASGQPRPHAVTAISGGSINTTFTYDVKGNMTAGNGLTVSYASYNKPTSITRGTSTIGFSHDPEHQRFQQTAPGGTTLYLGAVAERFAGSGGTVTWSNYLIAGGQLVGMHVERSDETINTRYFHKDHLGSIAVITDESGAVLERLSYDAWGKRRYANGSDDPAGAITSQTSRGFTGHEELDSIGLVHMNGRVYDPLLARFGTPDPTTEDPFSSQNWNRYSYVGNSPLNFTDPSGYCFLGCFFQKIFHAVQSLFRSVPILGTILQVAAGMVCGPACAVLASAFVAGVTSGKLGLALKAGFITAVTFGVFQLGSELLGFGGVAASAEQGQGLGGAAQSPCAGVVGGCFEPSQTQLLPGIVVQGGPGTPPTPSALQYVSGAAHGGLTLASFWPSVFGSVASVLDAGLYAFEGSWTNAGISFAAAGIGLFSSAGVAKAGLTATALVPKAPVVLGRWGETRLAQHLGNAGSKPAKPFQTELGPRYVDRLVDGTAHIAHESKAGINVSLTSAIELQVLKDVALIEQGLVQGAHWHFWQGASPELLQFLQKHGIAYTIH
jgi:RHS repeat-associated protein